MIQFLIAVSLLAVSDALCQNGIEFFEKKIRPVLAARCYQCHSAQAARTGMLMGNVQLDTREGVKQDGSRAPPSRLGNPINQS